jgi:CubicO group peptidase (beta-lactamase class C family)
MVIQDDETILHEAMGFADRESGRPLERNSLFRIRSMSKPMIGTAILMLAEEGRLSVNDRVADHLESFDNERSRDVRIRELLTHTSGLGNHGSEDIGLPKYADEYDSLAELVRDIGAIGPQFPRGEFRYSDSGSATLAQVVASISGMPIEEFFRRRLFEPLGMSDTYTHFDPDSTWAGRLSSTYRWAPETQDFDRYWSPEQQQRYRYFRGMGGVYSTPRDYARFVAMWMDAATGQETGLISPATAVPALEPEPGRRYRFQWTVPDAPPRSGLPPSFMHGGSDNTLAIGIPEERTQILVFTQSRSLPVFSWVLGTVARTSAWADFVPSEYRRGTSRSATFPTVARLADSTAVGFVGRFRSPAGDSSPALTATVWGSGSQLHMRLDPEGIWGQAMRDLVYLGEDQFALGRVFNGRLYDYFPEDGVIEFIRSEDDASVAALRFRGRGFSRADME